jgi:hypothetical protein
VPAYFPDSEIIEIKLSFPGFEKLCRYIADSYAKDEAGHALPLGAVLYGKNRFYLSRETYHVQNLQCLDRQGTAYRWLSHHSGFCNQCGQSPVPGAYIRDCGSIKNLYSVTP